MKTSSRHRWVPHPNKGFELCRDCGLEIAHYRIKGGGLGECVGKACERQDRLPLISGDPQNLGNRNPDIAEAHLACVGCGMAAEMMIAHRSPVARITGWVFSCGNCYPYLQNHALVFVPNDEKEDTSVTKGQGESEGGEPAPERPPETTGAAVPG